MDLHDHEKRPSVDLEEAPRVTRSQERAVSTREWDAARYDAISNPQARWGATVADRLDLCGDETVLDAGCGSGRVTEVVLERLPRGRVVAVDASESMLSEARQRLFDNRERVHFIRCDLLDLTHETIAATTRDNEHAGADGVDTSVGVDAVISTATFHWITDHDRLFDVLASLLRPGGQLVAQCGGEGNIDSVIEAVRSLGVERAGTWLYASSEETARRLERAGFTDVVTWTNPERVVFPPGPSLAEFLEVVCLREHLATVPPEQRRPFVEKVIAAMDEPAIDYVRLNIVARRSE